MIDLNVSVSVETAEGKMLIIVKDCDEFAENPRKMCDHYTKFYTWLRGQTSPDSVSDIAARYSFTESKVKNMLYHSRNKLREYLKKEGIEV